MRESLFHAFSCGLSLTSREHVIVWLGLLQNQPHPLYIVPRMTPIAPRVEISEIEFILLSEFNRRHRPRDFPGHEGFAARWSLMVEQDAVRSVNAVCFAVVDSDPICVEFGRSIRRSRIKWRCLAQRPFLYAAIPLRRRGLVKANAFLHTKNADCFQHA